MCFLDGPAVEEVSWGITDVAVADEIVQAPEVDDFEGVSWEVLIDTSVGKKWYSLNLVALVLNDYMTVGIYRVFEVIKCVKTLINSLKANFTFIALHFRPNHQRVRIGEGFL